MTEVKGPVNGFTKVKALRLAAMTVIAGTLAVQAAHAVVFRVLCADGTNTGADVSCASGTPYAGCACTNWSSSGGYSGCYLYTGCY